MAGKLFFLFVLCCCSFALCRELKQVMILSRHNLRTPLSETLQATSPKVWLNWNQEPAQLTNKGAILESYLGKYFSEWLTDNGLIHGCPNEDSTHVFANTRQRTKDTAQAFVNAFHNCSIPVISKNSTEMDPVFNPIIRNTSEAFKRQIFSEMNARLNETDLRSVYLELNRITNIKESQLCKEQSYCDLANDKNEVLYQFGKELDLAGPLYISALVVDAFLMAYYEGFPLNDIAWGEIKTQDQLEMLTTIVRDYQTVRFNLPESSKDIAKPLLEHMHKMIRSNKTLIMLFGHDSNLNSVISALGFTPFTLPGQFELSPIGGKLVFQRWSDGENDFLKVEYVYGSWPQIRNKEKLSRLNPPKNITMYFNNLPHVNGFYPWNNFEELLQKVTE